MNINKMLKGAVAALTSAAALGALTAPAFAASGTYDLNGKGVDALSVHGGAQRIATIGNAKAKNVILFIGDGMGDSEITVARNYLHGVNGTFQGLDKIGQPGALQTSTGKAAESGVGQYTTFSLGGSSNDSLMAKDSRPAHRFQDRRRDHPGHRLLRLRLRLGDRHQDLQQRRVRGRQGQPAAQPH